jgi:hypothetical protein
LSGFGVLQLSHPFLALGDVKTKPPKLDYKSSRKAIPVAMVNYENKKGSGDGG